MSRNEPSEQSGESGDILCRRTLSQVAWRPGGKAPTPQGPGGRRGSRGGRAAASENVSLRDADRLVDLLGAQPDWSALCPQQLLL